MAEKGTEEIIDTWFFEAPVSVDGVLQAAPEEAIKKRDELKERWLPTTPRGRNEAPLVKLTRVFEGEKKGWKVETAMRSKPDTTSNTNPVRNN